MLRSSWLLLLFYGVAESFVGPTLLSGRANTVYTRRWGARIDCVRGRQLAFLAPQRSAKGLVHAPTMSLSLRNVGLIIAEGGGEANVDLPISSDAQEAVVSTLSVASSVLLFVIIAGSVYITFNEWRTNQATEKADKFIKNTGELPPSDLPAKAPNGDSEEDDDAGNRRYRRMAKREKQRGRL